MFSHSQRQRGYPEKDQTLHSNHRRAATPDVVALNGALGIDRHALDRRAEGICVEPRGVQKCPKNAKGVGPR